MNAQHLPPEALDEWCAAVLEELGINGDSTASDTVPIELILRVAADVAHGVARPAAPLSTFLLGLAFGRSEGSSEDLDRLAARLTELAKNW